MKGQKILHYLNQAKVDDNNNLNGNNEYEPADDSFKPRIQQFSRKKRRTTHASTISPPPRHQHPIYTNNPTNPTSSQSPSNDDLPLPPSSSSAENTTTTNKKPHTTTTQNTNTNLTQMHLDFGQRNFNKASKCPVCGLLYTKGQPEDEKLHFKFHSNATKGLRYPLPAAAFSSSSFSSSSSGGGGGGGGDRIIARHPQSGTVTVMLDSINITKDKKVQELASFLEDQMGLVQGWLFAVPGFVFLEVSADKRIIGCVVLERIRQGFPIITTTNNNNNNNKDDDDSHFVLEDNNKKTSNNNDNYESSTSVVLDRTRPQKASFGVRLLWVSVNYRRQGLGGRLLDTARTHCMPGYVAQRAALAFSQPTAEGRLFMKRYTGLDTFLVYDAPS